MSRTWLHTADKAPMHAKKPGSPPVLLFWLFLQLLPLLQPLLESFLRTSWASHRQTTLKLKARLETEARIWVRAKANALLCNSVHASPGLEEPSLILIGLAMLTRIVRPKSSDSFCKRTDHRSTRAVWTIAKVEEGKKQEVASLGFMLDFHLPCYQ